MIDEVFHANVHDPIDVASDDWASAVAALEKLELGQIRMLAHALGMNFVRGEREASKEDYINILDETYWDEFQREYLRIVQGGSRR